MKILALAGALAALVAVRRRRAPQATSDLWQQAAAEADRRTEDLGMPGQPGAAVSAHRPES